VTTGYKPVAWIRTLEVPFPAEAGYKPPDCNSGQLDSNSLASTTRKRSSVSV